MTATLEQQATEDKLVGTKEIADFMSLSVTHVRHRLSKDPRFPRPIWIGGAQRWWRSQVVSYVKGLS